MAYYDRDYQQPKRHDSYYSRSRDANGYSRHAPTSSHAPYAELTAMRNSVNQNGYSYSHSPVYEPRYAAQSAPPPPLPKRSSAYSYRPDTRRRDRWPPSPSVEEEAVALAREFPTPAGSDGEEDSRGEAKTRGTVDQYPIIEELEQPNLSPDNDDRRFVLVSDPSDHAESNATIRDRRRKSFAERGNMPHLKTDIPANDDVPVIPKRVSTPYAYTKPAKESTIPSAGDYFLSPESITPSASNIPRSVPGGNSRDSRDQNARSSSNVHGRYDSVTQSSKPNKSDVFDDSDAEQDTSRLRSERKPARYSFVKNDLQKEDLRTNLVNAQGKSERRRREEPSTRSSPRLPHDHSSSSSKNSSPTSQSPRSSTGQFNTGAPPRQKQSSRPVPTDTGYSRDVPKQSESRPSSPLPVRPSSPLHRDRPVSPSPPRSPKLPPRRPADSPPSSRPSSRSGPRYASPLVFSETTSPPSAPSIPVTAADWHATYPPTTANDRSRPPSSYGRYESMPVPMPRIDIRSPSPARPARSTSTATPTNPSTSTNPLPYPVDDRPVDVFMPPEAAYQFDHSLNSPAASTTFRQVLPDSPRMANSPVPSSPREPQSALRPSIPSRHTAPGTEDVPRLHRVRSSSMRSQTGYDPRQTEKKKATLTIDKPLPVCPRTEPSARHDLWYTLDGAPNFDICPTCFEGVFADTHFSPYFKVRKGHDRSMERYCDFSSPWMRLAWLITVKQQRQSPDLIYALASITDVERPCPRDRELASGTWYGIPDPRDGVHISNFAICTCDLLYLEALFPSVRGCFTRIPQNDYRMPRQTCSVRVTSRRFPKYLDLLVELDEEARLRNRPIKLEPFLQLARTNAFKRECQRDKQLFGQAWHFIPQLPEFTVCEECYDDCVLPAIQDRNKLATMFNRAVQFVPNQEGAEGASCCLYSKRMRRVWERAMQDDDFRYLKRKAVERKDEETRLKKEKRDLEAYLDRAGMYLKGTSEYEKVKRQIADAEDEWKEWE